MTRVELTGKLLIVLLVYFKIVESILWSFFGGNLNFVSVKTLLEKELSN